LVILFCAQNYFAIETILTAPRSCQRAAARLPAASPPSRFWRAALLAVISDLQTIFPSVLTIRSAFISDLTTFTPDLSYSCGEN
jgi:hypothetical protein